MAFKKEDFIKDLKEMKVSDLNNLIKAIEEEFGVSSAVMAMAPGAGAEQNEESSEKTVELVSAGGNKIAVIKVVREILGLGLMDAKKFAEQGGVVKEKISPEEAEQLAAKFKEAGAEIKIK